MSRNLETPFLVVTPVLAVQLVGSVEEVRACSCNVVSQSHSQTHAAASPMLRGY